MPGEQGNLGILKHVNQNTNKNKVLNQEWKMQNKLVQDSDVVAMKNSVLKPPQHLGMCE